MTKKWFKKDLGHNIIEFTRGEDCIFAPHLIGDRYLVNNILSVSGGFGIIFIAQDTRVLGRKVLVKARRYNKEEALFAYEEDTDRKTRIQQIRRQVLFEFNCLRYFRRQGESRMPNVNDLVYGFSPIIHGPHTDQDTGEKYSINDPELINEEPYIIMQMIEGQNLGDYISEGIEHVLSERGYNNFRLWEENVLQYARELCTIFAEFHKMDPMKRNRYFIYQDLKPENIMITYDTFLTLIDFGGMTLVREDNSGQFKSNWPNSGIPGLGTYGYKAPEMDEKQKMLSQLNQQVDVYAIGATLFHLLTGIELTRLDNEYGPLPLHHLKEGKYSVTDATFELIKKATLPNREERYQNISEMRKQIPEAFKEVKKYIEV